MNFEGYSSRKIGDAISFIHRQHKILVYLYYISDSGRQTNLTLFYQYSFVQYNYN